jgi:hypothetical protein
MRSEKKWKGMFANTHDPSVGKPNESCWRNAASTSECVFWLVRWHSVPPPAFCQLLPASSQPGSVPYTGNFLLTSLRHPD